MEVEADQIPSSPTNSSGSSSDLDTESTGSFFHDRSTTLGTLMGVTFPEASLRPSRPTLPPPPVRAAAGERRRRRGRSWWRLCRDDMGGGPTSLGDFLQIERSLGAHTDFLCGAAPPESAVGGAALFEDGRVAPPRTAAPAPARRRDGAAGSRIPVLLTGICSGGEG